MLILAETPGMFWTRPDPEAAPWCAEGDQLDEESQIGVVEVMKMFVPQPAGTSGRFVRYLVEDGALVDVGAEVAEIDAD